MSLAKSASTFARSSSELATGLGWRVLRLLSYYRLLIGGLFFVVVVVTTEPAIFGTTNPSLFFYTVSIYWAVAAIVFAAHRFRTPPYRVQVIVPAVIDLFAITLLVHASGGVSSGLGILLIVFIAGVSVLVSTRTALAFAAGGSILILFEQSYLSLLVDNQFSSFVQAGILGGSFFVSALLANALGRRTGETEALVRQREVDLANLTQLNEYIVQRMASGVIVVDENGTLRLINESALFMMGDPLRSAISSIDQLSAPLNEQLQQWLRNPSFSPSSIRIPAAATVIPRFTQLGTKEKIGVLILLEDTSMLNQQAQTLKLTALGRLTASIAHEIRNPLGAISHAAQLLEESDGLSKPDRRLVEIIQENSVRTNTVIENVMQLTRRDKTKPEELVLKKWIDSFIEEFSRLHQLQSSQIGLDITPADVRISFDPSHLHQILFNLCNNAISHGSIESRWKKFELRGGLMRESRGPFLDIIDYGPGIDAQIAAQIFEPFFTTASKGTGLGLYIAKELAEVNQAHLDYIPVPAGGSCFRITFAQPKR